MFYNIIKQIGSFCIWRAARLGYEVAIENKELFFRTPEISEKQLFTVVLKRKG